MRSVLAVVVGVLLAGCGPSDPNKVLGDGEVEVPVKQAFFKKFDLPIGGTYSLTVTPKSGDVDAWVEIEETRVIVHHRIANRGTQSLDLNTLVVAPGRPRVSQSVRGLAPGTSVSHELRNHLAAQHVEAVGRFIQQQHRRPMDQGSRQVQALPLTGTERGAALTHKIA